MIRDSLLIYAMVVLMQTPLMSASLRQHLASQAILAPDSSGLVSNLAFLPPAPAGPAHEVFEGTLTLKETEMGTSPSAFASRRVLGRDPKVFPAAKLSFFTDHGELVPTTEEVIRCGSIGLGRSYWDLLIQPGQIWSEPGDGGWSRAAFPFALVNSREGETHNGFATFLFRHGKVSPIRFQIIQQTAPYYVPDVFSAWGAIPVSFNAREPRNLAKLKTSAEADRADRVPIRSWDDLALLVGRNRLADFDSDLPAQDFILSGLFYRDAFYLHTSHSAAGMLPWLDRMRFGVWSVTKSAVTTTALLRLAQKYGDGVLSQRINDYVTPTAHAEDWEGVTFADCINMATGVGSGTTGTSPNHIFDGEIDSHYAAWYEARTLRAKLATLFLNSATYPWGPGRVARYRDQDMFILGVAMDRYLRSKEGPKANLMSMLQEEVFEPIGIHQLPINRTLEPDGSPGQPLMAFGAYLTLGDMVKIGRLYGHRGMWKG